MTKLDTKTRNLLDLIEALGEPPVTEQTPEEFRNRRNQGRELVNLPWPDLSVIRDIEVAGATGPLKARLYDIEDGEQRPTLIYFHGGGFVYGGPETHDPLCRRLADAGGFRLISVEYRLAPEAPYPAAVEDAIAATIDIAENTTQYGVDPTRVAVGGDSAGACLAAIVARQLKRDGRQNIAFQLLIYPVTQSGEETESRRKFAEGYFLTKEAMDWFEDHYLPATVDREHEWVSPLRNAPPEGLAPALVVTAGFDPLRDEGHAYAESLKAAGIAVDYIEYPDQVHGFVNFTAFSEAAVEAIEHAAHAVKSALS